MTKYEELAGKIALEGGLLDGERKRLAALLERELAPLVEAALQVCYCNSEAFPKTSEDLREALRSALKGWER